MVFSGTEGADVGSTVISLILQASLLVYLGLLWVKLGNPLSRSNMTTLGQTTSKGLALVIIGAIAVPILTAQGWLGFWDSLHVSARQDLAGLMPPLLEPVFRTGSLLTLTIVCALATAAIAVV